MRKMRERTIQLLGLVEVSGDADNSSFVTAVGRS